MIKNNLILILWDSGETHTLPPPHFPSHPSLSTPRFPSSSFHVRQVDSDNHFPIDVSVTVTVIHEFASMTTIVWHRHYYCYLSAPKPDIQLAVLRRANIRSTKTSYNKCVSKCEGILMYLLVNSSLHIDSILFVCMCFSSLSVCLILLLVLWFLSVFVHCTFCCPILW